MYGTGLYWGMFAALFCGPVELTLNGSVPNDRPTMESAAKHCYEHHWPDNPCLVFLSREVFPNKHYPAAYKATCGPEDSLRW